MSKAGQLLDREKAKDIRLTPIGGITAKKIRERDIHEQVARYFKDMHRRTR